MTGKKVVLYYKSTFFQVVYRKVVDQKKNSEFEEPLVYTFLEKWLQIKWPTVFCVFFKNFVLMMRQNENTALDHQCKVLAMQNKCGSVYFADFYYFFQTLPYLHCLPNQHKDDSIGPASPNLAQPQSAHS